MEFSEQELVRRDKLKKIKELGINPYPAELFPVSDYSSEIKNDFKVDKKVVIAGRLMSRRIQGNASFAELQDSNCLLYTSPSPRDATLSRMPSSA